MKRNYSLIKKIGIISIFFIITFMLSTSISFGENTGNEASENLSKAMDIHHFDVNANAYNSIKLTWDKVEGANGYVIYGMDSPFKKNYSKIVELDGADTTTYIHTGISGIHYYKIAIRYEENGENKYSELSLPVLGTTIDPANPNKTDYSFPKIYNLELVNNSTILPGTIDVKVEASDEGTGIRLYSSYIVPVGYSWCSSCGIELKEKSFTINQVLSSPIGITSSFSDERYQNVNFKAYQLEDCAGNVTYVDASDYISNTSFRINNEFDFEFEGVLSSEYLADNLRTMPDDGVACVTIDSASKGILKKECLDALKNTNKKLVVYCSNDAAAQWIFEGSRITGETKDLNLIVNIKAEDGNKYDSDTDVLNLKFADNGQLPGYVQFRVMSKYINTAHAVSDDMYLYYLANNIISLEDDDCDVKQEDNERAWCYIDIEHNSTYLLSGNRIDTLPAPSKVSVKLYGYDDIYTSWTRVEGADGYRVAYKRSTASTYSYKYTTGTCYKLPNLTDGAKYYVKVTPYVLVGTEKKYSATKAASAIYTLKKVGTPSVKKYAWGKVKVSWANIAGESGYQISKAISKSKTTIISTYSTTSGKYKIIKAAKGRTYYYKVRAYKTVDGKKIYGPWSYVKAYRLK